VNNTDPTGKCPWCLGAFIGGVLDAGLQLAEIALDDGKSLSDFSVTSVLTSAAAGAVGVGLVSKIGKIGKIGRLGKEALEAGADTATSIGSSLAKGEDISASGVLADVVGGKIGGSAGSKGAKQTGGFKTAKQRAKTQERRSRDSRNSAAQKSRRAAEGRAARTEQNRIQQKGGIIGSGLGGKVADEAVKCVKGEDGVAC
jgi:hypothetical protein